MERVGLFKILDKPSDAFQSTKAVFTIDEEGIVFSIHVILLETATNVAGLDSKSS